MSPQGLGTRYPIELPQGWFHCVVEPGVRLNFHRGGSTRVWNQVPECTSTEVVPPGCGTWYPSELPQGGFHKGVDTVFSFGLLSSRELPQGGFHREGSTERVPPGCGTRYPIERPQGGWKLSSTGLWKYYVPLRLSATPSASSAGTT